MSDISRYVKLNTVVGYTLDELNKSDGDRDLLWVLSFRALIDIFTNIINETKTIRLPVEPNLTVPFPPDLIKWSKIGVLNGANEISTLKINNQLTKFKDNSPGRLDSLTPDVGVPGLLYSNWYLNYWGTGSPYHLFGVGGGIITPGECVVDEKNRVIILGPNFPYAHIMLEYVSSPEKDDDYQIDIFCQEAVIAFIKWKLRLGSEDEYYNRVKEARRKIKPLTLQEINQALREGNSFKIKA